MNTPIALIIFNRPHFTEVVFSEILKAKPEKLFIIADGPRPNYPDDLQKCISARAICDQINWKCEVFKNYSEINMGCGKRPATGISWVFEHVDRAIILEDDCVPNQTFFRFCEELLDRYYDDERIMQINGNNFQFGKKRTAFSYFFSRYSICWGWATWRRAWQYHDMGTKLWPSLRETLWLKDIVENPIAVEYWKDKFDQAYNSNGNIHFWDYQWTFACWSKNGLSIMPNETLVSNIGCGAYATHTKSPNNIVANLPTDDLIFPLKHPPDVKRNVDADKFFIENIIVGNKIKELQKKTKQNDFIYKLARKIYSILTKVVKSNIS